ncbi:MAG: hypothetical protein AMXMBFR16_12000 [Candidatus Uhrbacteria bacterium]
MGVTSAFLKPFANAVHTGSTIAFGLDQREKGENWTLLGIPDTQFLAFRREPVSLDTAVVTWSLPGPAAQ